MRSHSSAALATVLAMLSSLARADDPSASGLEALAREQQALFDRLAPSVVYLSTREGLGSGFFVSANGLILTNAHVVDKAAKVDVVLHDGRRFVGQVVERGQEDVDVALVQIPEMQTPALVLSTRPLRVGTWVASIGHGLGTTWSYTTGMVSNIYPVKDKRHVFQTQIPLNPGNSGGPVFDTSGQVVGIVTAGIKEANSINFAILAELALASLKKLKAAQDCACFTVTAPKGVPIFVNGKLAGQGPRVVFPAQPGTFEVFAVIGGHMKKQTVTYPRVVTVTLE